MESFFRVRFKWFNEYHDEVVEEKGFVYATNFAGAAECIERHYKEELISIDLIEKLDDTYGEEILYDSDVESQWNIEKEN